MKKTFRTVALLSVLGIAAMSCQKEVVFEKPLMTVANVASTYSVNYTVDGTSFNTNLTTDEEWLAFLNQLFVWAEEGRSVDFSNAESFVASKQVRDVVTYKTRDRQDAKSWANAMSKEGYSVHIDFDSNTGVYTCIATKR